MLNNMMTINMGGQKMMFSMSKRPRDHFSETEWTEHYFNLAAMLEKEDTSASLLLEARVGDTAILIDASNTVSYAVEMGVDSVTCKSVRYYSREDKRVCAGRNQFAVLIQNASVIADGLFGDLIPQLSIAH